MGEVLLVLVVVREALLHVVVWGLVLVVEVSR